MFVLAVVRLDIVFMILPGLVDAADKAGETDPSETTGHRVVPADATSNVLGAIRDAVGFFETTLLVFDTAFFAKRDVPFTPPVSFR